MTRAIFPFWSHDCAFQLFNYGGMSSNVSITTTSLGRNKNNYISPSQFTARPHPESLWTTLLFMNRCRFLRQKDREQNKEHYPALNYPEVYILHGGYKAFFENHKVFIMKKSDKISLFSWPYNSVSFSWLILHSVNTSNNLV